MGRRWAVAELFRATTSKHFAEHGWVIGKPRTLIPGAARIERAPSRLRDSRVMSPSNNKCERCEMDTELDT
mgnify:CR=1 FL=1